MQEHAAAGKVVVITGASSGFGKGAALRLASQRATVVLAARRARLLQELADACEAAGGRALPVATDVSEPGQVERLAYEAASQFGRIDVWVNNAGAGALGEFDQVPLDDHIQVIDTNLLGTLCGSHAAIRQFKKQGYGVLINVASVLGVVPAPNYSSYVASKFAVVGLSGALRQELAHGGWREIRVCTVLPASADTPFFDHAANYTGHEARPIPPVYEPEDVVQAITKLASEPQDELAVGAAAKAAIMAHHIAPSLTERVMNRHNQSTVEKAPPARETRGSLQQPIAAGSGVSRTPKD